MLTHSSDSRQCVNTGELSWLLLLPRFHPWKASLLRFRSSSRSVQAGKLSETPPALPLLHPLSFHPLWRPGTTLWWSLPISESCLFLCVPEDVYLSIFLPVRPWLATHSDKHTFVFTLKEMAAGYRRYVLPQSASHPVLSCRFLQGTVQWTCWRRSSLLRPQSQKRPD